MANEKPRIIFSGGGTGGHLYPALAVADELARRLPGASIEFIGAQRGLEQQLVPDAGYPLRSLRLSGIKGRILAGRATAAFAAAWAVLRCLGWLLARRPSLVIGVGGFASGPAMLAARLVRVPTMVMEQNHFPGATNRWLAGRVDLLCLPSTAAQQRLGGLGVVTGNPVRQAFTEIGPAVQRAEPSILVFGGSRGAHSINVAMADALTELGRLDPLPRIVHQTGAADESFVRAAYADYPGESEVHAFLHDMPARIAVAELVVCRAGASTLSELAAAGRPAILAPYPHAADDHQRHNAESVHEAGAAWLLTDAELDGARLGRMIGEACAQRELLAEMGLAARKLARPDAAATIAGLAQKLIGGRHVP